MKINIDTWKMILSRTVINNKRLHEEGLPATTLCITGMAGIGKSSTIKQVAEETGMRYVHCDLAQMEVEDLVGFPYTEFEISKNGNTGWVDDKSYQNYLNADWNPTSKSRMTYAIPKWLDIQDDTPIILCLDDFSRSNNQLMQAIMNITLNQEYMTWKLPKGSTVVLTGNPSDDTEYQVTELDAAQKDRFAEYELEFDKNCWAKYTEGKIPSSCINFILLYPENVVQEIKGETKMINSPRSWTSFFNDIRYLDFKKDLDYLQIKGSGFLNGNSVLQFVSYINNNLHNLPTPEQVFKSNNVDIFKNACIVNGQDRADIKAVLSYRIINFLNKHKGDWNDQALGQFILSDVLNKDNTYNICRNLPHKMKAKLIINPEIQSKILDL